MNPLSSALAASAACGDSMGSDTFYRAAASMGSGALCLGCNLHEGGPARFHAAPRQYGGRGGFFWGVIRSIGWRYCFAWAVTCMRAGQPVRAEEGAGSACGAEEHAGSTRPHARRAEDFMGSDTFYNERWFLWEVVRLVQAVTCVRTTPRRRRGIGCRLSLRRGSVRGFNPPA